MNSRTHTDYGALVGWSAERRGGRVVVQMQSVTTPPPHSREDVHNFLFLLDRNQAVQLGNYLFEIAGETPPRRRRRSWLDRVLGG